MHDLIEEFKQTKFYDHEYYRQVQDPQRLEQEAFEYSLRQAISQLSPQQKQALTAHVTADPPQFAISSSAGSTDVSLMHGTTMMFRAPATTLVDLSPGAKAPYNELYAQLQKETATRYKSNNETLGLDSSGNVIIPTGNTGARGTNTNQNHGK